MIVSSREERGCNLRSDSIEANIRKKQIALFYGTKKIVPQIHSEYLLPNVFRLLSKDEIITKQKPCIKGTFYVHIQKWSKKKKKIKFITQKYFSFKI